MSKLVHRRHFMQAVGMTLLTGCSRRRNELSELQRIDINEESWTHPFSNMKNTNYVSNKHTLTSPPTNEQWRLNDISSPGIVSDGEKTYAIRQQRSREVLCELNRKSGESNWIFHPERRAETIRIGLPTASRTTIYVNIQFENGNETESFIYAIARSDGTRSWKTRITSNALVRLHSSGVAIVTQQGPRTSSVLALDANTGDERWRLPKSRDSVPFLNDKTTEFDQRSVPTTVIQGDSLYVPLVEGDRTRIHVLDIVSGETRRKFTVPVPVESTLVATNGLLYGTSHSLLPGTTVTKSVYAVSPRKESLRWCTQTTNAVYQLGISESAVYFRDNGVRCLDATTGTEIWHTESGNTYPSIVGDYVTSIDPASNRLRFRGQRSGEALSTISLNGSGYVNYVAADEESLYITKGETLHRFT